MLGAEEAVGQPRRCHADRDGSLAASRSQDVRGSTVQEGDQPWADSADSRDSVPKSQDVSQELFTLGPPSRRRCVLGKGGRDGL